MRFSTRLAVTLRLIYSSLFAADLPSMMLPYPVPRRNGFTETMHASPGEHADTAGNFSIFVPGAFPLAATFVLFRLKRRGFSNCRVVVEQEGLRIEARR